MFHTQLSSSKHHGALLAAKPGRSPSIISQGDEHVILNQHGTPPPFPYPPSYSRGGEAASSSQQQNLDPSVLFDTCSNVCQQQLAQQQHSQELYGLIERLTEKLDLVSGQSISARDLLEATGFGENVPKRRCETRSEQNTPFPLPFPSGKWRGRRLPSLRSKFWRLICIFRFSRHFSPKIHRKNIGCDVSTVELT
jgi:hypothetical protein